MIYMKYRWFAIILVLVTTFIFGLQTLDPKITDDYALVSTDVLSRPWTLITSIFLHGSLEHLLFNMIALGLFGSILEKIIGSNRFLVLYFLSGIIAGIGGSLFYNASIGASGAIFGVIGALGVLRPRMTVYVGYVPMPMALAVIFWASANIFGLYAPDQVAYASHLFGLAFGIITGLYLRKYFKENYRLKRVKKIDDSLFKKWEDTYMR